MNVLTERRAEFVYNSARLAAIAAGAPIVPVPWEEREDDFQQQFLEVIERQCGEQRSGSPEELHGSWMQAYLAMGWKYGPAPGRCLTSFGTASKGGETVIMKQRGLMRRFSTFDLWEEEWRFLRRDEPLTMYVYRNKRGDFVDGRHGGRRNGIIKAIAKYGIAPVKCHHSHSVCSIGRGADGKWYGWSHRAMVGFGKGDRIFEERYGNDKTLFVRHGRKTIKTDRDARLAASRFARSVS